MRKVLPLLLLALVASCSPVQVVRSAGAAPGAVIVRATTSPLIRLVYPWTYLFF